MFSGFVEHRECAPEYPQASWVIYTSGRCRCCCRGHCLTHLHLTAVSPRKSPKKVALAGHFSSDPLADNAQQRSEALSLSTTLVTTPESLEPLSLAAFSKKKRCRCYM